MANLRLLLWAALALILWLNYETWNRDYRTPLPPPVATATQPGASTPAASSLDQTVPSLPKPAGTPAATAAAVPESTVTPAIATAGANAPRVRVATDVLDLDISLRGGELTRADLPGYPKRKAVAGDWVRLFDTESGHPPFVFQSGLTLDAAGAQPDHLATFTVPASEYQLAEGQNELKVPLSWSNGEGVTVTKTYSFKRGSYAIPIEYEVRNESGHELHAASYGQLLRQQAHIDRSMFNVESYAFAGPAVHDGTRYRKLNMEKEEDQKFSASVTNGWLAAMQHHFVAALVPPAGQPYQFALKVKDRDFLLSAVGPAQVVPAGATQRFTETVFVGPKLQKQLEATGPHLELTADYGRLTLLAKPLFKLLGWVHSVVGNWGWSIILVTALIKLAFYPLSQASGRSMAKMRGLAPRIKNIQERYKDEKEQLGRAMMELYKREKINPLAGCLPILVQIPVFLAFYWVLLESVEMRQAPFMLWINDLSSRDPVFILPLLMGAAMFGQYKLNPTPPDPIQAKVFMFMPVVMTVMFAWFPSGLVLYWLTNTLLSIAQQWNINRLIAAQAKPQD